jgi:hypothetical protein
MTLDELTPANARPLQQQSFEVYQMIARLQSALERMAQGHQPTCPKLAERLADLATDLDPMRAEVFDLYDAAETLVETGQLKLFQGA